MRQGSGDAAKPQRTMRQRVFDVIEIGNESNWYSRAFDGFLIILIIANVIAFAAETVVSIHERWHFELFLFDHFSVAVFTAEYIARLWTAVEVPFLRGLSPLQARFKFATQPFLLIDLLAIAPFYLSYLLPFFDLRVLRLLRVFRFLKLARYSPALYTLMKVLSNERRALLGALILTITMLLFAATGIYFIERDVPGTQFTSMPASAWWAIATLTTVGYGDIVPTTYLGKMFGAVVMLIGLGLFALPIAIISTGFAQESTRRDFVVTWSMLSRIPLFAQLSARSIADIMDYLQAHTYPPNWEIIHRGEPGHSMFFIASGSVIVERPDVNVTLRAGDFFGEIAMIEDETYEYGFTTLTHVKILELSQEDYSRLCRALPEICDHIGAVAVARQHARKVGRKDPAGV